MNCKRAALALAFTALLAPPVQAQVGGNLAALPATDLRLAITTGPAGEPLLSQREFQVVTGDYYRLNLKSDGKAVWRVEVPDLLQNSHLRLLTIGGVEVHLQGLMFRALEFDEADEASFTFTPIRPGTYELYVGKDPRSLGRPIGEAGIAAGGQSATARFVVR
jgi:hypothetical protein